MPDPATTLLPAWKTHLPNALTLVRVALAAALFAIISLAIGPAGAQTGLTHDARWLFLATGIFSIAALTDALDGYFARRWHVVSPLGRVMDPFADKILILGSFICLAGPDFHTAQGVTISGVTPWIAIAILARELLVTTIRGVYEAAGVDFSANWAGKWKMILQCAAIPAIFLILAFFPALPGSTARTFILGLVWITLAVTVWSGIPYVSRAIRSSGKLGNKVP